MWAKIKKALAWIGGGLIAVLFFIIGLKNRKIRKTEEQLESAEERIENAEAVHEEEESLQEVAQAVEAKVEGRIQEIRTETVEKLAEAVKADEAGTRYNEIIGSWNNNEG